MAKRKKTISLALGSGGARGLAHIGVIKLLEEKGYEISSIAGCSIGAAIGGIYAMGKLAEYEEWIKAITKFDILTLMDFSFSTDGVIRGDKLINTLKDLIGDKMIEDLPIKYTAVATELEREKEIWIDKGPLFDAIRSSISFPFLFTPYDYCGKKLIDGGVLNPIPTTPTLHDMTDMTIAVSLHGTRESDLYEGWGGDKESGSSPQLHKKIKNFISSLAPSSEKREGKSWGLYAVTYQSLDLMQGAIARQKLAANPPDLVISIPRNACRMLEFFKAKQVIDLGYRKAKEALKQLPI